MMKGMSPGTALVLLMAGPAANVASMLVIGKILGKKTFLLYLGTLVIGAISCGLLIDNFLPASWFDVANFTAMAHHGGHFYYIKVVCSVILLILFVNAVLLKKKEGGNQMENTNETCAFKIGGMRCNHCKSTAAKALSNLKSVKEVNIDLGAGLARIKGNPTDADVKEAVEAVGFEFKGRV